MKKFPGEDQGKSKETEPRDGAKDIQEKLKNVDVNRRLLPSGVARVKQLEDARAVNQAGSSASGSATGTSRNKTALAPGHSLMDWIRLGNSGVDLTGVGGVSKVVTLAELATHNTQNDAWIAIRGIVFNITRYMDFHPGGVDELMRGVGRDATKLFENVHPWVNYQSILQKCVVGKLSRVSVSGTATSTSTENSVPSTDVCSTATLSLLTSCATHNISSENVSDTGLSNTKMAWKQTSQTITLYYQMVDEYPGVSYHVTRINDLRLLFKLFFEKDVLIHQLELTAEIEWPPRCTRNFESMEVEFAFTKQKRLIWKSQGSQTISRRTNMNELTYREYQVLANKSLSKLVHLLVVRAKDYFEIVPIGRYVQAKMKVMGMEVTRMYTPVPPCLHPNDVTLNYKSDCLCFVIKKYPRGALSPSITALKVGQTLSLSNSLGTFVVESYDTYPVLHMLAGGTGLTPMLSIIQRALARRNVKRINLLNFNKNEDNMFYEAQLKMASTGSKLKVTHILSSETENTRKGRRGRLNDDLLKELAGESKPDACVFVCGPVGFSEVARNSLQKLGWKPHQVYQFEH